MFYILERTVGDEVTEVVYFTVMLDDVRVQTYTPYYEVIWDCDTTFTNVADARKLYRSKLDQGYVRK